jgi:hypothetical protein
MLPIIQNAVKRCGKVLLWVLISGSSISTTFGLDNHWFKGGGDMYWTNTANWSLGVLPDSTQDVFLEDLGTNAVVLNGAATVRSFKLDDAVLDISGGSLSCMLTGKVHYSATLNLNGTLGVETLEIDGLVKWSGGQFNAFGKTVVNSSGNLEIGTAAAGTLHGSISNLGTVTCFATNLLCGSGFRFVNNQLLVLHSNLTLSAASGISLTPQFQNAGTLEVPDDSGMVRLAFGFTSFNSGEFMVGANAALELMTTNNAVFTAQDGAVFGGAGVVRFVEGPGEVMCEGYITVNGTVELAGGDIYQGSMWTGPGLFRWLAGSMGWFVFDSGFHVEMSGPGEKIMHGMGYNHGEIRWRSEVPLLLSSVNGALFDNSGEFILETNFTLEVEAGGFELPHFYNSEALRVPEGAGKRSLILGTTMVNEGTLLVGSNTVLELTTTNNGSFMAQNGTVFGGAGVVRFAAGTGEVMCDGNLTVNGTVELDGADIYGDSLWGGTGRFRWLAGSMGDFTFGSGLHVEISGMGAKIARGYCVNDGEIRWLSEGPLLLSSLTDGTFENLGDFILETNCSVGVEAGGFAVPQFYNSDTLRVPEGAGERSLIVGAAVVNGGALLAGSNAVLELITTNNGAFMAQHGAVFGGAGVVRFVEGTGEVMCDGNLTVNGTVELDGADIYGDSLWGGTGRFRWLAGSMGDFTFGSGLHVEISGMGAKIARGYCVNDGEIRWLSEGPLLLSSLSDGTFENLGEFILETNCTVGVEAGGFAIPQFYNFDTVRVPEGAGERSLTAGAWVINRGSLLAGSNAVLELTTTNTGRFEVGNGTVFAGSGVVRLSEGAGEMIGEGNITVNGTVELDGANIYTDSDPHWNGPGLFRWLSGTMWGFSFEPGFHVEMSGPGAKMVRGHCLSYGEIRWLSAGPFLLSSLSEGSFNNAGQFILETNCIVELEPGGLAASQFYNSDTVRVPEGSGERSLTAGAWVINRGSLLVGSNAVLELTTTNTGKFEARYGTVFNGPGVARFVEGTGEVWFNGNLSFNGTVELDGADIYTDLNWEFGSPYWSGPGLFRWLSGSLGNVTFASGFHVEMSGPGEKSIEGECANMGEVRWLQDSFLSIRSGTTAIFFNNGVFRQETGGSWDAGIAFDNFHNGTFSQISGKFSTGFFANGGTLKLEGGILNPQPGISFYSNSKCEFVLGGTSPGTGYGQIESSDILLGGPMLVTLTNGFVPTGGAVFQLVTNGVRTAKFSSVSLPVLSSNLVWNLDYQPKSITLQTVELPVVSTPILLPDGAFHFTLTGFPGGSFEVQTSTNLIHWQVFTNGPFGGVAIITDPVASDASRRFYRGRLVK